MDPALIIEDEAIEESKALEEVPQKGQALQNSFTLWVFMNSLANDGWKPKKMASFGNVDQFWNVYQHLKRPSDLEHGTMLNLFVKGIEPAWEDPANSEGGRW